MAYDDRALRGVGGWLALSVLTLAAFSPLSGAVSLAALLSAPTPPPFAAGWPALRALAVFEFVAQSGLAWFLAWRLVFVQTPATPRIVVAGLWIGAAVLQPILVGLGLLVSGISVEVFVVGGGRSVVQGLVYAMIWTLYLHNSQRVANTYRGETDELHAVFE